MRIEGEGGIGAGRGGSRAMDNGKMIGWVCGMSAEGRKMALVVPAEEISWALQDASDGQYDGKLGGWAFTKMLNTLMSSF